MLHYFVILVSLFPMIGIGMFPSGMSGYLSIVIISLYAIYIQIKNREKDFSFSKSEVICVIFIAYLLLLGYSQDQNRLDIMLSIISTFVLYCSVRRAFIDCKQLYIFLVSIGSIISIIAIFQFLYGIITIRQATPIHAFFDNPAGAAASLLVTFPFSLYMTTKESFLLRNIGLCSAILIAVALILSQSRAGILGALICIILIYRKEIILRIQNKKYYILSAFIIVLIFAGLYILKRDSANGRVLIWKCCLEMINDNVLFGGGPSAFSKNYMIYQAEYFRNNPTSVFMRNADEIKVAQNHILEFLVNYGMIGVLITSFLVSLAIKEYKRRNIENRKIYFSMSYGILVMSCFSYPLNYAFVVNTTIILFGILMRDEKNYKIPITKLSKILRFTTCIIVICFATIGIMTIINETEWKRIAVKAEIRQTDSLLAEYEVLLPKMLSNHYFLYNYSFTLCQKEKYDQSISVLNECTKYSNDYNIQLLYAENYRSLEQTSAAMEHLNLAHNMIPIRFLPLYKMFLIQKEQNNIIEAKALAVELSNKDIKVNSMLISKIKREVNNYLSSVSLNSIIN